MTNTEAIKYLKSKLDGKTDTSWEWTEVVRLAINALERVNEKSISETIEDILIDCEAKKENRENCVMLNIVAEGAEEPYYMIEYYDKRDNTYHQGFGSKNFEIVKAYQKAYFDKWNRGFFEEHIIELESKLKEREQSASIEV